MEEKLTFSDLRFVVEQWNKLPSPRIEYKSIEWFIEKYGDYLTEEDVNKLKEYGEEKSRY